MTAAITGPRSTIITEPGLYAGIPDAVYHADPVPDGSLSVSGAKVLARNPARYHYDRLHPRDWEPKFNHGHAAHSLMLGVGPQVVEIAANDWRSPKTRGVRDQQLAAGRIPLLTKDAEQVKAMRDALAKHPHAAQLLSPGGAAEISAFRTDPVTGCWLRARFDYVRASEGVLVDYKTAESADPAAFARKGIDFGYHMQAGWYLDQANGLGLEIERFVFVVQEKVAPFLVSVVEYDADTLALGRAWNRYAIDRWVECLDANTWPGYPDETVTVSAPPWAPRPPIQSAEEPAGDYTPQIDVFAFLDELNPSEETS